MKEHYNKWKKYNKTEESRNIVKYFTCSKTVDEALKEHSNKHWISMAKLMNDALIQYLDIKQWQ